MALEIGDKGTIKRGKLRGQRAEVFSVHGGKLAVAVGTDLVVLDPSSFEKDAEPTIELRAVINAVVEVRDQLKWQTGEAREALSELANKLDLWDTPGTSE